MMLRTTLILLLSLIAGTGVAAEPKNERARQQALSVVNEANEAFGRKDFARAEQLYAAAYAIYPSDKLQYSLGRTYEMLERWMPALDAFQRYLALPEEERTPDRTKLAREALPKLATHLGRVVVFGEPGQQFQVDEGTALTLPQPPVFVEPGEHRIHTDKGDEQVTVAAGGLSLVKLTRSRGLSNVAADRELQRALVLPLAIASAEDSVLLQRWVVAAEAGAQTVGLTSVDAAEQTALWTAEPELRGCARADCLERLGQLVGARVIIRVRVEEQGRAGGKGGSARGNWTMGAEIFEVAVGEIGASGKAECPGCTEAQAEEVLVSLVRQHLQADLARPRGKIEVRSVPPRADVFINGRRLGFTPFTRPAFVGKHDVAVARLGFRTFHDVAVVAVDHPWAKEVNLVEGVDSDVRKVIVREETLPRPLWRKAVGGALVGSGLIALVTGIVLFSLDGKCTDDQAGMPATDVSCRTIYATRGTGSGWPIGVSWAALQSPTLWKGALATYGLMVGGVALGVGGSVLIALPPGKRQVELKLALAGQGFVFFGTF